MKKSRKLTVYELDTDYSEYGVELVVEVRPNIGDVMFQVTVDGSTRSAYVGMRDAKRIRKLLE